MTADTGEYQRAKCNNKNIVAGIGHEEYQDVWLNKKCMIHRMSTIKRKHHKVKTLEINKISLSCFDDKRYIFDDGIETL